MKSPHGTPTRQTVKTQSYKKASTTTLRMVCWFLRLRFFAGAATVASEAAGIVPMDILTASNRTDRQKSSGRYRFRFIIEGHNPPKSFNTTTCAPLGFCRQLIERRAKQAIDG